MNKTFIKLHTLIYSLTCARLERDVVEQIIKDCDGMIRQGVCIPKGGKQKHLDLRQALVYSGVSNKECYACQMFSCSH